MDMDLTRQICEAGLFTPPTNEGPGVRFGTAAGLASAGSSVAVLLDGDTANTTILTAVRLVLGHRVMALMVNGSLVVIANLSGSGYAAWTSVSASTTAGQTISSWANTTVVFDTEARDYRGEHNASTGVVTLAEAGKYVVSAAVAMASATWVAGNIFRIRANLNGATYRVGSIWTCQVNGTYVASSVLPAFPTVRGAGETIEVEAYHNRGLDRSLITSTGYCWMSVERIG